MTRMIPISTQSATEWFTHYKHSVIKESLTFKYKATDTQQTG